MIFGIEETPDWMPCRVYDANGMEIHCVERCDTETGDVTVLATDEQGNFYVDMSVKPPMAARRREKHVAPLLVVRASG